MHIRQDNKEPFYIGKGCKKRAYVKSRRTTYWKNIVNKYGYEIIILEENLTEEEALIKEKEWIAKYGRKDLKKGTLVNLTDGGETTNGYIHTKEAKEKMSNNRKGIPTSELQKKVVGSRYKNKFAENHNRSKAVRCKETGIVYGSQMEAQRQLNLGNGSVCWSIKYKKPIFGMHFEIAK